MFSASITHVKTTIMMVGAYGLGEELKHHLMEINGQQMPLILKLGNTVLMLTFLFQMV